MSSHCKCAILLPSGFTPALSILMKKTLITIAALAAASFAANAELIGQWDFNDTLANSANAATTSTLKGSTADVYKDSVDQGYILSTNADGEWKVRDDMGSSIQLGNGSYVSIEDTSFSSTVSLANSFTLGAYFYIDGSLNFDNVHAIFSTGSDWTGGLSIGVHSNYNSGNAEFVLTTKGHSHNGSGDVVGLTMNAWHHMAVSYDATTKKATWYLDGFDTGLVTNLSSVNYTAVSNVNSSIGSAANGSASSFDGTLQLDRVQVFNTALTAYEVRQAAGIIPEPTTATLSLLALAGLAAHRRRK